jgi:hypothetical protein
MDRFNTFNTYVKGNILGRSLFVFLLLSYFGSTYPSTSYTYYIERYRPRTFYEFAVMADGGGVGVAV